MLAPLDLPETNATAAITVSIARSTDADFQTAAITCLRCMWCSYDASASTRQILQGEADIIIILHYHQSITQTNTLNQVHALPPSPHSPPPSRGRRINFSYSAAGQHDSSYLLTLPFPTSASRLERSRPEKGQIERAGRRRENVKKRKTKKRRCLML